MLNGSQTLAIGCPTNPATSLLFCCAKLLKKAWGKAPFFSMHAFHLLTSDISSSILFKRSNCQKESGQAVLVCSLSKARHIRFYPKNTCKTHFLSESATSMYSLIKTNALLFSYMLGYTKES